MDDSIPYPTNQEIARILFQVAGLLEMTQDNVYRVRAYRRAGFRVLVLPDPLVEYAGKIDQAPLPGVGERIRGRLQDLVNTGHMGVYETLLEELGEPAASLLSIHGVGPKTATRLIGELRLTSLSDVVQAAREGRIQRLRGFGPKREAQLAAGAELMLNAAA